MKNLLVFLFSAITLLSFGQSTKKNVNQLPRLAAAPALTDLLLVWDTSENATKKMTVADLNAAIGYSTLTGGHGVTISNDTIKLTDSIQYGKYLPDTSTVLGTDTVSLDSAYYVRVGKAVTVWGSFKTYIITSSLYFQMTIPIASDFSKVFDLGGSANSANASAAIFPHASDKAYVTKTMTLGNPETWTYSYTYYLK